MKSELERAIELRKEVRRRAKLLYVPEEKIVTLLNLYRTQPGYIQLPTGEELPEGYEVLEVFGETHRSCMALLIHHPSFPVVPPGAMPPDLGTLKEWKVVPFQDHVTNVQKWPKFYKKKVGGGIVIRISETEWTWDLNDDVRIEIYPDWDENHIECDCTGKPL